MTICIFPDAPLPMAYKREAPPTLRKGLTVQNYLPVIKS